MVVYQFPFSNPNVADGFGSWGTATFRRKNAHRGLDFPQPRGTPVGAVADGVVAAAGFTNVLGYWVSILHADGMYSGYCHSDNDWYVYPGDVVSRGSLIGLVGNTGFSTGAHLHLTIGTGPEGVVQGHVQDPYAYILARLDGTVPTEPGGPQPPTPPEPVPVRLGSKVWNTDERARPSVTVKAASGKVRITASAQGRSALITYSIPGIKDREAVLANYGSQASQLILPKSTLWGATGTRSWVQEGLPKDEDVTITLEAYSLEYGTSLSDPSILAEVVY